ncbi:hypothetical protein CI109_103808 [Kwoniella shandongensis]|uniref:DIS3-like exonuclease 2 n=1 Tax=Kwoniella shandongensis TaxID=1734106 RepID=A0A5M6C727_9TREE|nr:uncharacterized protein CI109_000498 [Kwoniella shandongensis]KAA5530927.1 hypothetical protein CI109_000498 [Kwoniella shandongensis]
MADSVVAPAAVSTPPPPSSTLAPPQNPSRPSSAGSNRSGSSRGRGGRSSNGGGGTSSNISRSNSNASSRGASASENGGGGRGDKKKQSGPTTTISGGVSLGVKDASPTATGGDQAQNAKKSKNGGAGAGATNGKGREKQKDKSPVDGDKAAAGTAAQKTNQKGGKRSASNRRPTPITTAPPRSDSRNSDTKPDTAAAQATEEAPRSLHAHVSAPRTAMQAAVDAANQKSAQSGALANLQKMISDLKTLPTSAGPSTGSSAGSRSTSGVKEPSSAASQPQSGTAPKSAASEPVKIPDSASSLNSAKKLKADAPSFTPSFTAVSPIASASALSTSPASVIPPVANVLHPRSTSTSSAVNTRRASSGSMVGNNSAPFNASPIQMFPNTVPGFFQNQLAVHQETDNEAISPLSYAPQQDFPFQQQQLLAAQQQQYQYIQLLQAQLTATQLAAQQQQHVQPQQQQMGSFIAPRFQALAAQRALAQQQQQAAQLAQAQQIYELQQAQLLQQQEELRAQAAAAEAVKNQPVFEEESPEPRNAVLGPTGRPQLAPSFTFGAKPKHASKESISERASARDSMSPPQVNASPPIVVNRSEGIGGAAATGLAGLAARAHRRTGSEISPAMQQQLAIQQEIEALQAKQKELMQQDLASQGESPLTQLNSALHTKQTPSQTLSRHRRVQSSLPTAATPPEIAGLPRDRVEEADQPRALRNFGEMPPPPVPTGHSRRHSVNVFNKAAGSGAGFGGLGGDIPEDGVPNGGSFGHHRSSSRSGMESGNWRMGSGSGSISGFNSNNNNNMQVADLAAAQAQLQSLAQFRAAAGGGHTKMASFSFPNMLPNLLAATTLQAPVGQSLWQQQQAFQMQLQQTAQGPQRKSLFAPYLPQASLPPLLQAGKLVVGVLRVNKKNRSDAYVATDVLEADIYICGSKDRNRALEGDIVAVELLDVDEVWGTKKDKEEKKRKKEENAAYDLKPSTAKKLEKKKDDVEVEGQGLTLFDDEEVNDETKPTYAGHVVAVVERMPGQLFSGQLGVLRPSSAATKEKQELERREREGDRARRDEPESRPKIVWFKPTDKRVPLIAIPTEQAPSDFIDNPDAYGNKLFVATIKRWPITSLHPFGTLVEELGPIGDKEVETSALLKDCNFPAEEFTDLTMKCLPPLPWSIPEREYEVRTDLRNERVFTIDPPTAKDLDDALSVKSNEDGTITVGVHIADVSYFVKANTAMDREARKRATSVYLVQRAVPMLPPQISEELCSLVPNVERLTFSAIFTLDTDGNVKERKFARTIIKSCGKLSYADAQGVVSGGSLERTKVADAYPVSEIEADIRLLHDLATKIKTKRIEAGAMLANKLKVSFELDDEGKPVDCNTFRRTEANSLVEEFMLLANTSVAQVIANGLPEQSILRRHEAPIERRLDGFVKRAQKLGFEMDPASAGTLQKSFEKVQDPDAALCLELLKKKSMQRARYFCTGMLDIAKYSHWALNTPLYTHFTSPIRRYADVLVHRMLDACLTSPNPNDVKFHMDRDQVAKCAQQCNMKKQSAKLAEEQSVHLYLCMLIYDLTERYGPVVREAKVTGVLDAAFDVVIPEFGIEKRVHVDKMPVENVVYDEHKDVLSLYWTNQDVLSFLAETTDDPHLLKIRSLGERHSIGNSTSRSADETALFETGGKNSKQYAKSAQRVTPKYEGLRNAEGGHKVQDVRELMTLPVIVTSDMTKSPPVLVVYACNPYSS